MVGASAANNTRGASGRVARIRFRVSMLCPRKLSGGAAAARGGLNARGRRRPRREKTPALRGAKRLKKRQGAIYAARCPTPPGPGLGPRPSLTQFRPIAPRPIMPQLVASCRQPRQSGRGAPTRATDLGRSDPHSSCASRVEKNLWVRPPPICRSSSQEPSLQERWSRREDQPTGTDFPASDRSHSHRHKASSINRGRPIGKREGEQFVGKPGFVNVGANSSSHLSAGGFTPTDPQRDNTQDE